MPTEPRPAAALPGGAKLPAAAGAAVAKGDALTGGAASGALSGARAGTAATKAVGGGVQGAIVGGAEKMLRSRKGRRILIAAACVQLVPLIAVVALVLSLLGGAGGASMGGERMAAQAAEVVGGSGIAESDQAAMRSAVSGTSVPWTLLAALVAVQRSNGSSPKDACEASAAAKDCARTAAPATGGDGAHAGPYWIDRAALAGAAAGGGDATDEMAQDIKWSSTYIAGQLSASLKSIDGYGDGGRFAEGAQPKDGGGFTLASGDQKLTARQAATQAIYIRALKTLKVRNAGSDLFMTVVYSTGLNWFIGNGGGSRCQAAVISAGGPTAIEATVGYTEKQASIQRAIVERGIANGVPDKGIIAALDTAAVESGFHVWASLSDPPSLTAPASDGPPSTNGGYGDHGSLGVFQQQTQEPTMSNPYGAATANWGTWEQLMDPATSADLFYSALMTKTRNGVRIIESISEPGVLAQTVQVSAFPDRYAQKDAESKAIFASITGREPDMAAQPISDVSVIISDPAVGTAASSACTTIGGAGTAVLDASNAVEWILEFARVGYARPYSQCRPACADIGPEHTCYRAFAESCLLAQHDCSGFTRWVMWNALAIDVGANTDIILHKAAQAGWLIQSTDRIADKWQTMDLQLGDIIVFSGSSSETDPSIASGTSHVGIYTAPGKLTENGGDTWQGEHDLYNQGSVQWVIRIPGLADADGAPSASPSSSPSAS